MITIFDIKQSKPSGGKLTFSLFLLALAFLITCNGDVTEPTITEEPNLVEVEVAEMKVSENNPTAGQSITLSTTVSNVGFANASEMTLLWYLSTDSTIDSSDTLVASTNVTNLSSGENSFSIDLSVPTNVGTYYYGVCVRALGGESDTASCSIGAMIVVQAQAPTPDLIIAEMGVSDDTPTVGQIITLSTTVSNAGSTNASGTPLLWYLSTDSTIDSSDTLVANHYVADLSPGESSSFNSSILAPTNVGTYYYGACVEALSLESDTANNCSRGTLVRVQAPAPDLVVSEIDVSDDSPSVGQSVTLSTTVSNASPTNASETTLRWYFSTDSTIDSSDTLVHAPQVPSTDVA